MRRVGKLIAAQALVKTLSIVGRRAVVDAVECVLTGVRITRCSRQWVEARIHIGYRSTVSNLNRWIGNIRMLCNWINMKGICLAANMREPIAGIEEGSSDNIVRQNAIRSL